MSERNWHVAIIMTALCVTLFLTSKKFDGEIIVIIAMFVTAAGLEYRQELSHFIKRFGEKP